MQPYHMADTSSLSESLELFCGGGADCQRPFGIDNLSGGDGSLYDLCMLRGRRQDDNHVHLRVPHEFMEVVKGVTDAEGLCDFG